MSSGTSTKDSARALPVAPDGLAAQEAQGVAGVSRHVLAAYGSLAFLVWPAHWRRLLFRHSLPATRQMIWVER